MGMLKKVALRREPACFLWPLVVLGIYSKATLVILRGSSFATQIIFITE